MNMEKLKKNNKGITLLVLVITIIILLILAGITIATVISDNGIIQNANDAKEQTEIAEEKEIVDRATIQAMGNNKRGNLVKNELQEELDKITGKGKTETSEIGEEIEIVFIESDRYYTVDIDGNVAQIITEENAAETPIYWEKTTKTDEEWYSYADISDGDKEVKVNEPKLRGSMTAIKYVGEDAESQTGSKWANAITQDGSMWVWIPRYAYRITSGYHTADTVGTIDVAFIDTNNNFLNGETGAIVTAPEDVTYTTEGVQNEWLVHPAFTSSAENGGGFGELSGLWVGKFEATGNYDSNTKAGTLSVKPAIQSLTGLSANRMYKFAQTGTYGEKITLRSHMAKNSEWGAVAYLTQSKYGIYGQEVQRNTHSSGFTGGSNDPKTIYTTNKNQSTTYNSYGIYDMVGGRSENVASYVNYTYVNNNHLASNGGTEAGDFYGASEVERSTSTAYKTVYKVNGTNDPLASYNLTEMKKGDAIWETSDSHNSSTGAWFGDSFTFPYINLPFFRRSGHYGEDNVGIFSSTVYNGIASGSYSFRLMIVI